jgi:hypothetical protein
VRTLVALPAYLFLVALLALCDLIAWAERRRPWGSCS